MLWISLTLVLIGWTAGVRLPGRLQSNALHAAPLNPIRRG